MGPGVVGEDVVLYAGERGVDVPREGAGSREQRPSRCPSAVASCTGRTHPRALLKELGTDTRIRFAKPAASRRCTHAHRGGVSHVLADGVSCGSTMALNP